MSNSPLVNHINLSPNYHKRTQKITKITIHHVAGNLSVERIGDVFKSPNRQASSNYGVGTDGRIGMYVDEANRAWTSSSAENDQQAVTIEVANDGGADSDWHVSNKALHATIALCADICKRNGIKKLYDDGTKNGTLTRHCYFRNTCCPGPYLGSKFDYICEKVNEALSGKVEEEVKPVIPTSKPEEEGAVIYKGSSLVDYLKSIDIDSSYNNRKKLANEKGMPSYSGTASQNTMLLDLLRSGVKNEKPKKSNEEVAREVIAGKWGVNPTRKKKLEDAGYNYSAIQSIVNKLCK